MIKLPNHRRHGYTIQLRHHDVLSPQTTKISPAPTQFPLRPGKHSPYLSTKSYFSKFILSTAPTPSIATSIVHLNTCKNLLDIRQFTSSSSTNSTRGGTTQPGTNVDRRTRSFCAVVGLGGAAVAAAVAVLVVVVVVTSAPAPAQIIIVADVLIRITVWTAVYGRLYMVKYGHISPVHVIQLVHILTLTVR
jgi:hypothetical protein